jgi:hypothetical protein
MLFEPVSNVSKPFLGFPKKKYAARKRIEEGIRRREEKKPAVHLASRAPSLSSTEVAQLARFQSIPPSVVFLGCTAGNPPEPRRLCSDGTDVLASVRL